jgi:hypothetical protein
MCHPALLSIVSELLKTFLALRLLLLLLLLPPFTPAADAPPRVHVRCERAAEDILR